MNSLNYDGINLETKIKNMSTLTDTVLDRAVAPGISSPPYAPRQHRVTLIKEGREHPDADAVEALRTMADRVSDCVRLHAEKLMASGAIDLEEAQSLIWGVESAAGARTHCTPGYGPYESSILDSGGLGRLSDDMGVRILLGDCRRTSETAATARGFLSQLAADHYLHIDHDARTKMIRENFGKLSTDEQNAVRRAAKDLLAIESPEQNPQ